MLKPNEITEDNAEQAVDEMIAEMRKLVTTARRTQEVSEALAAQTGNQADYSAADAAEAVIRRLDEMLCKLMTIKNEGVS